jgi:hypothetical protein
MSENQDIKICLFAIMREEEKNVKRCIDSAIKAGVIDAICITDTGSTDKTISLIEEYSSQLPTKVYQNPFIGFGPSRTQSYKNAKEFITSLNWNLEKSYGITIDADMELFSKDFNKNLLVEDVYSLEQQNFTLNYFNTRLIKFSKEAICIGRTHEFWNVNGKSQKLFSLYIKDHNDGGYKHDKLLRDEMLLRQDLADQPLNSRSLFYLGNTLYNLNKYDKAIKYYLLRCQKNDFKEEVAQSKLGVARCYLAKLKNFENFINELNIKDKEKKIIQSIEDKKKEMTEEKDNKIVLIKRGELIKLMDKYKSHRVEIMKLEKKVDKFFALFRIYCLQSWNDYPEKNESLIELISFLRERNFHREASMYLEICFKNSYPKNAILFVNKNNYHEACYYEKSIIDFYIGKKREAADANDWVQFLGNSYQNKVISNRKFNSIKLERTDIRKNISIVEKFNATTPSIVKLNNQYIINVRHVNYVYENGRFFTKDGSPVKTNNCLLILDNNFNEISYDQISTSFDSFNENNINVQGYEDVRLFTFKNKVYSIANCHNKEGGVDMNIWINDKNNMISFKKLLYEHKRKVEKNWLIYQYEKELFVMYDIKTRLSIDLNTGVCKKIEEFNIRNSFNNLRLSSGPVHWKDDKYLIIVHDVEYGKTRHYVHRFMIVEGKYMKPIKVSIPFYFKSPDIEYVCGLCKYNNNYLIGYSIKECESFIAEIKTNYIESLFGIDIV